MYSNIMELNQLTAISPIDGRYRKQVQHLDEYYSEYALMKYRVIVEVEYFLFLAEKRFLNRMPKQNSSYKNLPMNFHYVMPKKLKKQKPLPTMM